jgi:hypothetical protein
MVQRVLGELVYGFLVGHIMHLLDDHEAEHGVELLGRRSHDRIVLGKYLLDGK